jgi:hypothetical protein
MSDFETPAEGTPEHVQPVSDPRDDDVPARRLLAHDLEHMVWDDDGDPGPPPPD